MSSCRQVNAHVPPAPLYRCLVSRGNARLRALCCCRKLPMQSSGAPRGVARVLPKVARAARPPRAASPSLFPSPTPPPPADRRSTSRWRYPARRTRRRQLAGMFKWLTPFRRPPRRVRVCDGRGMTSSDLVGWEPLGCISGALGSGLLEGPWDWGPFGEHLDCPTGVSWGLLGS